MAHIGFLHALRGLQPNKSYELTSDQLWTLVKKAGIKLKPSQSCQQNIKKFKSPQNYKNFVNSHIGQVIQDTMNQFEIEIDSNKQKITSQNYECYPETAFLRKKKHFEDNLPAILNEIYEQTTCPICLEVLILPVLTTCGHAFCYQCIDEHLLFSSKCPNCRDDIKEVIFQIDPTLQHLVHSIFQNWTDSDKITSYKQRLEKSMAWKLSREVSSNYLQIGLRVDIRDTELIWCKAEIVDIYYQQDNEVEAVLIHYTQWHKMYDQVIYFPSSRIAPLGFFTNRIDISSYTLNQPENNMRGMVTTADSRAPSTASSEAQVQEDESENSNPSEPNQQQNRSSNYRVYFSNFHSWNQMNIVTQPQIYLYSYIPFRNLALTMSSDPMNNDNDNMPGADQEDLTQENGNASNELVPRQEEESNMEQEERDLEEQ